MKSPTTNLDRAQIAALEKVSATQPSMVGDRLASERVQELLETTNRYLERARAAEATLANRPARERLPDRRASEAVTITHVWSPATAQEIHEPLLVTLGRYEDGRVGEVFIESLAVAKGKLAQRTLDLQKDVAVLISIALQYGAPIEELLAAVGSSEINLMGKTQKLPATIAGTVLAALAAETKR